MTLTGIILGVSVCTWLCAAQNAGLTADELQLFASLGISVTDHSDTQWLLEHVGIPDHEVGDFPNDDNPNSIGEQHHDYYIPKTPNWRGTPGCLPMGEYRMPDCLPMCG